MPRPVPLEVSPIEVLFGLTLSQRSAALTVPIPAVDLSSDDSSGQVVVVTPENRIEIRKVKIGIQSATEVEILAGLSAGDLVVTGNRASLRAGQQVRPKPVDIASQTTP